ncbi:MAG: hypothetical protein QOE15_681 [Acidimicrobiaceae bacterium]|jgi:hypothetical protein|nr:hypothetical protein [Acidimicrobiaceae bacterium]
MPPSFPRPIQWVVDCRHLLVDPSSAPRLAPVARGCHNAWRIQQVTAILDEVARQSEVPLTVVEIARRPGVHKPAIDRRTELNASLKAADAVPSRNRIRIAQLKPQLTRVSYPSRSWWWCT